jgi:predicted  nucleic acid-binding Zn-ribbon protein
VYAKDAEMLKKISDLNLSLANAHNEVADLKTENLKLKNELTKMRHSKRRNHD